MAIFECVGGTGSTGNALPSDVKVGVTFSNENDVDQVGTFAPQDKTIVSSRLDQIVIPDEGYYLSSVEVQGLEPTGVFTPTSRSASIDMGDESNYRYVNTESVPNNNSGTYTFPANSTGGTVDLGVTNTYRYANAGNVYNKGNSDGYSRGVNDGKNAARPYYAYYDFTAQVNIQRNGEHFTAVSYINIGIAGRITSAAFINYIYCRDMSKYISDLYNAECHLEGNTAVITITTKGEQGPQSGVHIFHGRIVGVYTV